MKYKVLIYPHMFLYPVEQLMTEKYGVEFVILQDFLNKYNITGQENFYGLPQINFSESFYSKFPSWFNNKKPLIEEIFSKSLTNQLKSCDPMVIKMDTGLQKEQIDLFMTWNDVTSVSKALVLLGKKYNIPSLMCSHGLTGIVPAQNKIWADKIAVFGESTKEIYLKRGNSEEKIFITGNPFWDKYVPCSNEMVAKIKNELKLNTHKKIVLYAATWYGFSGLEESDLSKEKRDLKIVISALEKLSIIDNIELVIKLHPGFEKQVPVYKKELERCKVSYKILHSDLSLLYCLQASDIVIASFSPSVLTESLLIGKPTILFNVDYSIPSLQDMLYYPNFTFKDAPYYNASNIDTLFYSLDRIVKGYNDFSGKDIEKILHRLNGPCDGHATERVAELAMEMMKSKKPRKFFSPFSYKKPKINDLYVNEHIVSMIDKPPVNMLSVGYKTESLREYIKNKYPLCNYVSVEINNEMMNKTGEKMDRIIIDDIEKINLEEYGIQENYFDYIIYEEILEHLYDPWTVLYKYRNYLKDNGSVIASISNIRNLGRLNDMINNGNWTYFSGTMDPTHIRFFTLKEIKNSFSNCGYEIVEIKNSLDNFYDINNFPLGSNIEIGKLVIKQVSKEEALEYLTIHFIINAKKDNSLNTTMDTEAVKNEIQIKEYKNKKFISIIILTYNQIEHTKTCLESIEKYTPEPHEIIMVDNGSTDGTVEFLKAYQKIHPNMIFIVNGTNKGFAAGNNQGLFLAKGEFVILLNNDTIVTQGWISNMLKIFEIHPNTGIAGPMSNYVSGPQLIKNVPYKTQDEMQDFAKKWSDEHKEESTIYARVVGFCLMASRKVVDKIGGLDEQFGSGNFEDDDFCIRAARAGYEARIAKNTFIHHTGSQTFKGANINYRKSIDNNWKIFKEKWGIPAERTIEEGYSINYKLEDTYKDYISLPDISVTHSSDNSNTLWEHKDYIKEKAMIDELIQKGKEYYRDGKFREAEETFREVINIKPEYPKAYNELACVLWQRGKHKDGIKTIKKALEMSPEDRDIVWNFGQMMVSFGHLNEVIQVYKRFLDKHPEDANIQTMLEELFLSKSVEPKKKKKKI